MDITGIITKKLQKQSGTTAKGEWQKQEFVITTEDAYPKSVCFNTWGPKVDELNNFSEGNKVKVHFDVSSREYNEKWYSEIRAIRIELLEGSSAPQSPSPSYQPNSAPSPASADSSSTQEDDLPF
jgi:hypothetical protein